MLPVLPIVIAGPNNAVDSIQPFKAIKLNNNRVNFFIFNDSAPTFYYKQLKFKTIALFRLLTLFKIKLILELSKLIQFFNYL